MIHATKPMTAAGLGPPPATKPITHGMTFAEVAAMERRTHKRKWGPGCGSAGIPRGTTRHTENGARIVEFIGNAESPPSLDDIAAGLDLNPNNLKQGMTAARSLNKLKSTPAAEGFGHKKKRVTRYTLGAEIKKGVR